MHPAITLGSEATIPTLNPPIRAKPTIAFRAKLGCNSMKDPGIDCQIDDFFHTVWCCGIERHDMIQSFDFVDRIGFRCNEGRVVDIIGWKVAQDTPANANDFLI